MKRVAIFIMTAALVFASFDCVFADEFYLSLDGEWDFCYYASEGAEAKEGKIISPGAMELQGYGYPGYYFEEQLYWGAPEDDGIESLGVYQKTFSSDAARDTFLVFDSVKDEIEVYLNDEKLGESSNAEIGCVFPVSLKKGENSIKAVITRSTGGINKADNFALSGLTGSVYLTDVQPYEAARSREVKIENDRLYIDGEETVLRGVKYTPTYPEGGDAISAEQIEKDLSLIKEYGFNAVWTCAAPPVFYEKAEEMRLYVIDEVNVYTSSMERRGGAPSEGSEAARLRAEETVKRHRKYKSVIMWSAGAGEADASVISAIESADDRPVVQKVNVLAEAFEVFGNTGGFEEWAASLGDGNIGGFIKEFADKELYWTKNIYEFEVTDTANGNKIATDGEIKHIGGAPYLGDAELEVKSAFLDRFTLLCYVSDIGNDRVIFESGDKTLRLEVKDWQAALTINGQSVSCSLEEGLIGAVYADGEAQLFAGHSFKANFKCEAHINGSFSVGGGDAGIRYIKVYGDALALDELLTGETDAKEINSIAFDNIAVKADKSYQFLAYGGDFGDMTNSYYKSVKGLFSSLREPHPEAEEVKALFKGNTDEAPMNGMKRAESARAQVRMIDGKAVLEAENTSVTVNSSGEIESFVYKGAEQLSEPMRPVTEREGTLSEYENGAYPADRQFETKSFRIDENNVYICLIQGDGRLNISYALTEDGALNVSMQSQFGENEKKPTFAGFEGKTEYTHASWYGKGFGSTYPDRRSAGEYGEFEAEVKKLSDNYAIPQENGNRLAYSYTLSNENGQLTFASSEGLEITALPYSFDDAAYEDHDESLEYEDASYIRVGGYIAGTGGSEKYKLNNSCYGFSFVMTAENAGFIYDAAAIYIDGEKFTDFAPGVYKYVYRTASVPEIFVKGSAEAVYRDGFCTIGDYTIYFAPGESCLSELEESSSAGEISKNSYFGTDGIMLAGDRFRGESDKAYQNGIAMKSGSEIVYDVSEFDSHTFTASVGKDASVMSMGRGFDRRIFDAEADVKVYLDGTLVQEIDGVSLFSGRKSISADVSGARELKIAVTGSGESPQYEDAVLADAKIVPKGPMVLDFSRSGPEVSITVLNTDTDEVFVMLSAADGDEVKCTSATVTKGLYRTLTLYGVSEDAKAEAVVSGVGRITFEK